MLSPGGGGTDKDLAENIIKNIQEADLPEIKAWLRKSYENHTKHFQWALTP